MAKSPQELLREKDFFDRLDVILDQDFDDHGSVVSLKYLKTILAREFTEAYYTSHADEIKSRFDAKQARNEREKDMLKPTWFWKQGRFGSDKLLVVFAGNAINLYKGVSPSTRKPVDLAESIAIFSGTKIILGSESQGVLPLTIKNPEKTLVIAEAPLVVQRWAKQLDAIVTSMRGGLSSDFVSVVSGRMPCGSMI